MSFRNRPTLDRKHRPRWQDELRSQQLIVAAFALAIAVAIGIFGAAAWSAYYDASLRQVALVDGTPIAQSELSRRTDIIYADLASRLIDLQGQLIGTEGQVASARDQILQQQIQAVNDTAGQVGTIAFDSLVTGTTLAQRAAGYGITVDEAALDTELDERRTKPERRKLSMIIVYARAAEDAPAGSEPTDEDWETAHQTADEILAEIEGGADFGTVAAARSDHGSKEYNGVLGWIEATDPLFSEYFEAAAETAVDEVIGPLKNDQGWFLVRVDEQRDAGPDELLEDLLAQGNVADADYRAYVRGELLHEAYREYFASSVIDRYQPQREVAQILIANDQGTPVPKSLLRHLLVQPLPGAESQAEATDEQWAAALAEAEDLREQVLAPDADWFEIAEQSDDPGSRDRGGALGWTDLVASGFVQEFADAAAALRIGEVSEPVRTEFGYHVIQLVDRRISAVELAQRLVSDLREDPDTFGDVARVVSEDGRTAQDGGELGWVIHYQLDTALDTAVFDLTEPDEISEPIISGTNIYLFKLIDSSEARFVGQQQREAVGDTGFGRWLDELRDRAGIWTDPEVAPAPVVGV
jgi:parvulin-like peptidyl-prolyl isomerase